MRGIACGSAPWIRGPSRVSWATGGPVAFWGDRIVMPDPDGAPWEVVCVEGGAQPGDVLLLFQNVADGVRGELWLEDGRHVQVGPAWDLTVDGGFVGTVGPPYTIDVAEDREGYVKLAERPDGLVVVSPWGAPPSSQRAIVARPFAADLVTGETWPLTDSALRATAGVGLVRVPGGPGCPAPMPPAPDEPDPQADAGVGADAGPMADVAADDEGCSCSVGAGGAPSAWTALALGWLWWRRRRTARARRAAQRH